MYLCAEEVDEQDASYGKSSAVYHRPKADLSYVGQLQGLILQRLEAYGQSHETFTQGLGERLCRVEAVLLDVQILTKRLLAKYPVNGAQPSAVTPKPRTTFEDDFDDVDGPLPDEMSSASCNEITVLDEREANARVKPDRLYGCPVMTEPLEVPVLEPPTFSLTSRAMSPRLQPLDVEVEVDDFDDPDGCDTRNSSDRSGSLKPVSFQPTDEQEGDKTPQRYSSFSETDSLLDDLWYQTQQHAHAGTPFQAGRTSIVGRIRQSFVGHVKHVPNQLTRNGTGTFSDRSVASGGTAAWNNSRSSENLMESQPFSARLTTVDKTLMFDLLPPWQRLKDAARKSKQNSDEEESNGSDVSTHLPRTAAWATPHVYQRQRAQSRLGETAPPRDRFLESYVARCIVSPWSTQRTLWDLIAICFIAYDLLFLPMQVFQMETLTITTVLGWTCTLYWTLDLMAGGMTGYAKPKTDGVELRPRKVCLRYMRTWLFFNIVAVTPDWIAIGIGGVDEDMHGMGRTVRVVRTLRILRLIRLVTLRRVIVSFEKRFNNDYMMCYLNLVKLMICMAVLVHYLACGWYGVSELQEDRGWASQSVFDHTNVGYKYLTSLHWSLTQFQGSMEVNPMTTGERAYAVVVLYLGVIVAGGFISSITNSMTRIQQIYAEMNNRRWLLLRYLSDNHISGVLSVRVKSWIEKALKEERTRAGEVELLKILPEDLRMDLELDSKKRVFAVHPLLYFLTQADHTLARYLSVAMDNNILQPKELLFELDAPAEGMYITMSGKLQYLAFDELKKGASRSKSRVARTTAVVLGQNRDSEGESVIVEKKSVVCEMAFWARWDHRGSCTAISMTDYYLLTTEKFTEAVIMHSEQGFRVLRYACNFVNWMNTIGPRTINDMSSPSKQQGDD